MTTIFDVGLEVIREKFLTPQRTAQLYGKALAQQVNVVDFLKILIRVPIHKILFP